MLRMKKRGEDGNRLDLDMSLLGIGMPNREMDECIFDLSFTKLCIQNFVELWHDCTDSLRWSILYYRKDNLSLFNRIQKAERAASNPYGQSSTSYSCSSLMLFVTSTKNSRPALKRPHSPVIHNIISSVYRPEGTSSCPKSASFVARPTYGPLTTKAYFASKSKS